MPAAGIILESPLLDPRTRALRDALTAFCNAEGALEAAHATGHGDTAALQPAADAARAALVAAYPGAYDALCEAPGAPSAHVTAGVLAEAGRLARGAGIELARREGAGD